MKYSPYILIPIGVLLLVVGFIFANLAIISPTGIESYPCYANGPLCYTQSKEAGLAFLYLSAGFVVLVSALFIRMATE